MKCPVRFFGESLLHLTLLSFILLPHCPCAAATFYFTWGHAKGGLGALEIDSTGKFQQTSLSETTLEYPKKMGLSTDGTRLLVTSDQTAKAWLYALGTQHHLIKDIELEAKTSSVAADAAHALVAASKGWFYWIDLANGDILKRWNAKNGLKPPGRKGEEIFLLPGAPAAFVTFQKDSKEGDAQGSRMLVFDLNAFVPTHDLLLPRDHPNLHIPSALKEQGPSPELIFVSRRTNTLILSLDLYGALAFADLDAAYRGEWKNLKYVASSLPGTWGNSFPDRGLLFNTGGREFLLVSNASTNGGLVLADVATRTIRQEFPAPAGAETPVQISTTGKIATVVSGKIKSKTESGLSKGYEPGGDLLVFDPNPLAFGKPMTFEKIPLGTPLTRVQAVDPAHSSLLLLAAGGEEHPEWILFDLASHTILSRLPALGPISRIVAAPN